jgi:hypothetical protein
MRSSASETEMQAGAAPAEAPEPRARTEEELLAREERRARADLRRELTGFRDDLLGTTDLSRRALEHPVLVGLMSAAAGFALARPLRGVTRAMGISGVAAAVGEAAKYLGIGGVASRMIADALRRSPAGRR